MTIWPVRMRPLSIEWFKTISGECNHLELYPVYSEKQNNNFNQTSWNKPWPREIDWLDKSINLSTLSKDVLSGLFTGYRVTKYAKYYSSSVWECFLMFPLDPDLADAYYLRHYASTNKTMLMCTPYFPVGKVQQYAARVLSLTACFNYELGMLEAWYERGKWSYVWDTFGGFPLVMSLSIAAVITVSGLFGKCGFSVIGVFPKWAKFSLNSANSGNLINHWGMNWVEFKVPVSHMCKVGAVVACWSLTQEVAV